MQKITDTKRVWAKIDIDKMKASCKVIREQMIPENTAIMAVLKADAYGHGAAFLAPILERECGIRYFAVACLSEAIELRQAGVQSPILILGLTDISYVYLLAIYHLSQTIGSKEYAIALNEAAKKEQVHIKGHIKINTGMNRLGYGALNENPKTTANQIIETMQLSNLCIEGLYSHLYDSLSYDNNTFEKCYQQYYHFENIKKQMKDAGVKLPLCHLCNTGGTINYPEITMDMVRVGSLLWGLKGVHSDVHQRNQPALQPILELKSKIVLIRKVKSGDSIGYSSNYIAKKDLAIAVVSCGYADGFSRHHSNRGYMLVRGQKAPVIGNVCMDMTTLDVTDIPRVMIGDIVTIIGKDGDEEISCGQAALWARTIEPEITTSLSRRVPRIYYRNHQIVHIENYLK